MSSGQKKALQSDGVGETFQPPAHLIRIAEEDPDHPHHAEHMARVRIDKPEMQVLLASLREFGWRRALTIAVYLDGDHYSVSEGRRRLTCVRIVNEERKAKRDKRGPIRPRVVIDDDPALTATLANSMREDDPPLVKARRFLDNRAPMGAEKAAAAAGLSLKDANDLAKILALPDAQLHAAVNDKEVAIDVAARAVKGGGEAVRKVLERSRGEGGKIDGAVAKKAAREVKPARAVQLKAQPAKKIAALADAIEGSAGVKLIAALRWCSGEMRDPPTWIEKALAGVTNDEPEAAE